MGIGTHLEFLSSFRCLNNTLDEGLGNGVLDGPMVSGAGNAVLPLSQFHDKIQNSFTKIGFLKAIGQN